VDEKTQAPHDTPASAAKPNERPKRIRRPYDKWRKETVPYTALSTEVARFEPTTFHEAINCDDSKEWIESMQEEINSLVSQGTWKLAIPPKGTKIITSKWVYKVKKS
jgi:hypothetical protein